MAGGHRKHRGDRAGFGILWPDPAETMPVKDQQSLLCGGYHELQFPAVRQQSRSKSYERRRWQVPARDELPGGGTAKIVFQEAARPTYIKMILKARRLQEDCGRANYLKAGSRRSGEWPSFDSNLSFRLNLFR